MRSAYLSVRCTAKGVSPFHSDRTPSSLMMVWPQFQMPAATNASMIQTVICFLCVIMVAGHGANPPMEARKPHRHAAAHERHERDAAFWAQCRCRPPQLVRNYSPVYFFAESSCRRVLIVSIGCRKQASMVPPREPAHRTLGLGAGVSSKCVCTRL